MDCNQFGWDAYGLRWRIIFEYCEYEVNCASERYGVSWSDKGSRPVTWVALAIIWTAILVFATIDSAFARSLGSGAASYAGHVYNLV
jgi:hypothetical protein